MNKSDFLNVVNEVCSTAANDLASHVDYEHHWQVMQALVQVVALCVDSSHITKHQEKALMSEMKDNRFFQIINLSVDKPIR